MFEVKEILVILAKRPRKFSSSINQQFIQIVEKETVWTELTLHSRGPPTAADVIFTLVR